MGEFNFNRMRYFVAVVEAGTITGAAEKLIISKAVVSKQILNLEDELGTALLHRNTRHLHPTDAGWRFFEKAKAALRQAEEAFSTARSGTVRPEGNYRITAPLDYGTLHLAPLLAQFSQDNPGVNLDLTLSDDRLDPTENQFDLNFRVGWPDDSSNRMRKVGSFEEWVVASPQLAGLIMRPEALSQGSYIANANLKNTKQWRFTKDDMIVDVPVDASLRLNATPAISRAVAIGRCYSVLPDFLVYDDVAAGRVCRLLPDWKLRKGGIYAVSPPTKHKPLAIRMILDMVTTYHKSGFGVTRSI